MAIIARVTTWNSGDTLTAAALNGEFNNILNDYNGNVNSSNILSIPASKITSGTFDTARLGSGVASATTFLRGDQTWAALAITEALLSLADNTTANVSTSLHGFVPKAPNSTTQYLRGDGTWATILAGLSNIKIGTTTQSQNAPSATQTISGVGFTPKGVILICSVNGQNGRSIGFDDATNHYSSSEATDNANRVSTSFSMVLFNNSSWDVDGLVSSFNSDGFVITWTKNGITPPTATMQIFYVAIG